MSFPEAMAAPPERADGSALEDHEDLRARRGLAQVLEDGPLKRELLGMPPAPPAPPGPPLGYSARLTFDGPAAEYFRIWIVNLLLTLLSLGVYSAWAKVRKARWFAQHTALLGDRFDYHGQPWRILAGRVLAVGLLALWTFAFSLSLWLGLAVLGLMLVAGPALFAGAQRFKLANTSWRGLRFGFNAPRRLVYAVCVPLLLVWTLGTVLSEAGAPLAWALGTTVALVLLLPWAHERLKRLQHAHAVFGDQRFTFERASKAFYYLYATGLVLAIAGALLAGLVMALVFSTRASGSPAQDPLRYVPTAAGTLLVIWIAVWPFFAARTQQIVWSRTRWGDQLGFAGHMQGWALWKLVLGQTLLTLLTAGLYWPFAAVAIARYRIEAIEVLGDRPLHELSAQAAPVLSGRAAGDAAAEFFGLDLGW